MLNLIFKIFCVPFKFGHCVSLTCMRTEWIENNKKNCEQNRMLATTVRQKEGTHDHAPRERTNDDDDVDERPKLVYCFAFRWSTLWLLLLLLLLLVGRFVGMHSCARNQNIFVFKIHTFDEVGAGSLSSSSLHGALAHASAKLKCIITIISDAIF